MRLEEEYWIEQIKDPTQNIVIENWISTDAVHARYEFTVHSELDFTTIFLEDQLDSEEPIFEGTGLDWSYWEYDLIQADGIAVITHGEMVSDEIILSTVGYGMDGRSSGHQTIPTPIAKAEWELVGSSNNKLLKHKGIGNGLSFDGG